MKITIDKKPAAPRIEYPCLMATSYGAVVLFAHPGVGMVLGSDRHPVGDYSDGWHMPSFTPFTGSVTLSND